jgi:Ca-activated chloride channel family protein
MSFHAPAFLLALVLLPLGAALYVVSERRRARRAARLVTPQLLPAVVPRRLGARRHVPVAFFGLALAGLLLALARPHATMAVSAEHASVVVLTDRSGSMQATDVAPTRLVAAKRAGDTFLRAVSGGVRVGAIAFNQQPTLLSSPTTDYEALRAALARVRPAGTTATGDALAAALQMIRTARGESATAPGAIVLLSDGKSVRGRAVLPVARAAARAKVPVYTVALGTASGTITDANGRTTKVPPDVDTLREVARVTGGEAYSIGDASELQRVYERLGSRVTKDQRDEEVTNLFAGGALLLAAFGVVASLRTTGRLI